MASGAERPEHPAEFATPPTGRRFHSLIARFVHVYRKTELAVLTGFGLMKNGHHVDYLQMGEAGSIIDEDMLRACNGYGLPPIAKILDDPCMANATWYV